MAKNLSGKVKKIPSTQVSPDRYNFLQLSEAEPDLGVPSLDGYVLSSLADGTRSWKNISDLNSGTLSSVDGGNASSQYTIINNLDGGFASGD